MRFRLDFAGAAAACLILFVGGCGELSRPYPEKSLHALTVGTPSAPSQPPVSAPLRVDAVRVAAPFDATTFYYKTGPTRFQSDYYNGFIAPPGRMLTGALVKYLTDAKIFSTVVDGSSLADSRYTLQANVTRLYGDYTPGEPKAAVVAARFFLIDEAGGNYNVVFEKSYQQTAPLSGDAPEDLAAAMGAAYEQILRALILDLHTAVPREAK